MCHRDSAPAAASHQIHWLKPAILPALPFSLLSLTFHPFSFPDCYAAEFGDLEITQDSHKGVPLEHFITCIPGVNIATAQNGVKVVKWIHNKPPPPNTGRWARVRD